jgi:hypothetical protein
MGGQAETLARCRETRVTAKHHASPQQASRASVLVDADTRARLATLGYVAHLREGLP